MLRQQAKDILPVSPPELGNIVAVDGSLIDAVPTMKIADYRKGVKKAKVNMGFNLNQGIPEHIALSAGKADERPFVKKLVEPGQTMIVDRYYQCHKNFDEYQSEGRHFVIRIKRAPEKLSLLSMPSPKEVMCFLM